MERNEEGHGDAEWHLQGCRVTKLLSSYGSKCVWLCVSVGSDKNLSLVSVAFLVCHQNGQVF